METLINGQLQIDHERGVIHFNSSGGQCILRLCNLPPIPDLMGAVHERVINDKAYAREFYGRMLDVSHMIGCDWEPNPYSGDRKMDIPISRESTIDVTQTRVSGHWNDRSWE